DALARHHALPRRGAAHERGDVGAPPRARRDGSTGRGRLARDLRPGTPRAARRGTDDGPGLRPAPARGGRAAGGPPTPRPSRAAVRRVTGTRRAAASVSPSRPWHRGWPATASSVGARGPAPADRAGAHPLPSGPAACARGEDDPPSGSSILFDTSNMRRARRRPSDGEARLSHHITLY